MTDKTPGAPAPWSLGEDPPAPATADPAPVSKPAKAGLDTHTGTDPHGRAIGPAEDHTKPKLDADGLTVPEAAKRREQARKAAERKAKAKP